MTGHHAYIGSAGLNRADFNAPPFPKTLFTFMMTSAADIADVPVYGPNLLGYVCESDCRDILRRQEGKLLGAGTNKRRIVLKSEAVSRVRARCNTSTQNALSTTQREELYSGSRKDHTDGPVTAVLTVIRRVKTNRFGERSLHGWNENDRFPRKRFNPDRIAPPIYQSERHYKQAVGAA